MYDADRRRVEERVVELLHEFELLPCIEGWFGTLPRGQACKAALLAVDPDLWMLDEPFASGMDPAS